MLASSTYCQQWNRSLSIGIIYSQGAIVRTMTFSLKSLVFEHKSNTFPTMLYIYDRLERKLPGPNKANFQSPDSNI